jgi:hypothetical protein
VWRRIGQRLFWPFLLLAIVTVSLAFFGRSENFLIFGIPYVVAASGGTLIGYRQRHGFWPWNRKRRKIERWRWLVEGPEAKRPASGVSVGAAIFAVVVVLVTLSVLTSALLPSTVW